MVIKHNNKKSIILIILALIIINLLISLVTATNDPGHDQLYIEEQGSSELNGSMNITQNLKVANLFYSDYLDILGNGSQPTNSFTQIYTLTSGNDLVLNAPTSLYLLKDSGSTVYVGNSDVDLNISGALYVQSATAMVNGKNICLADGTNCPAGANQTGNVTGQGLANRIAFWTNNNTISYDNNLTWNNTAKRLGIGTTSPEFPLDVPTVQISGNKYVAARFGSSNQGSYPNEGIYTGFVTNEYGYIGANAYYNGGNNWKARATEANFIKFNDGTDGIEFYADTGLTVDNDYTPTERVRITNDGKVGIGTTSPSSLLELNSTNTNLTINSATDGDAGIVFKENGVTKWYIRNDGNDYDTLKLGSAMVLDGNSVGIGSTTSGPQATLDVRAGTQDTVSLFSSTDNRAHIQIQDDDTTMHITAEDSLMSIGPQQGISNQNLNINTTGAVGIGTLTPTQKLDVNGNINTSGLCLYNDTCINSWNEVNKTGGGISGSGTTETLAKFTDTSTIGDSIISESGNTLTINGNISMPTTFYIGSLATATGYGATAIGRQANATGTGALALGYEAKALSGTTISIGRNTNVTQDNAIGIGRIAQAKNTSAIVIGYAASSTANGGIAIGGGSDVTGNRGVAIAVDAQATNDSAIAIGNSATATGEHGTAMGYSTDATGKYSTALGRGAQATKNRATALGYNAQAINTSSTALGERANATGYISTAIGRQAQATNQYTIAIGYSANATQSYATAIGHSAQALHSTSIALGRGATTTAANQLMIGSSSYNLNTYIHGNLNVTAGKDICLEDGTCLSTAGGGSPGGAEGAIQFYDSGSLGGNASQFFLNKTTGNVGIGTTSPGTKLHISGTRPKLKIYDSAADEAFIITSNYGRLDIMDQGENERITLEPDGNVGIGTTSPNADLELVTDATTGNGMFINASSVTSGNGLLIEVDGTTMSGGGAFKITRDGSDVFKVSEWGHVYGSHYRIDSQTYMDGSDRVMYRGSDSDPTIIGSTNNQDIWLYPHGTGNVGIGTTSPDYELDVNGNTRISGSLASEANYEPIDDDLILYLPFSEGTGNITRDKSKYGNDGIISGSNWTKGKFGNALSFSGTGDSNPSNDYVTIPDTTNSSLDITSAITMQAWIKTSVNKDSYIITKDNGWETNQSYALNLWNNRIYVILNSVTNYIDNSDWHNGNWHHLAVTWNGSIITYYLDGKNLGTDTYSGTLQKNNYNLTIGARTLDKTYAFNGTIDEVRIYNRSLREDEIRDTYIRGLGSHGTIIADNLYYKNTTGATRLFVNGTNGRVGIGTTSPNTTLHVDGTINATGDICEETTGTCLSTAGGGSPGGVEGAIQFYDGGSLGGNASQFFLNKTTGNVGIGTTSPDYELDVNGFTNTKSIHKVSDEGLVLAMNFNSETITGPAGNETILDSSGYNNQGTNKGAMHNATGSFNGGGFFEFNGSSNYISVPDGLDKLMDNLEHWSVSMWIYPRATSDNILGSSAGTGMWVWIGSNYRIGFDPEYFGFNNPYVENDSSTPAGALNPNEWNHLVIVRNKTRFEIYKKGKFFANLTSSVDKNGDYSGNLQFGRPGTTTNYDLDGKLDNVMIFNRSLSANEVKALYLQRAEAHNSYVSQKDVHVDSTGNVGIGTTSPNSSLQVEGNISQNDNYRHCFGDNCDAYMYFNGSSLIIKVT